MDEEVVSGSDCVSYQWTTHPAFEKAKAENIDLSSAFTTWTIEGLSEFAIGMAPREVVELLRATSATIVISQYTYEKQKRKHSEITPDFYSIVPVIFREGEVYESIPNTKVNFVWESGEYGFEVIVKGTSKGELYLASFFRAKRSRIEGTRRKYRRVR